MSDRLGSRTPRIVGGVLLVGLWAASAVLLWRSRLPGNLELPRLDQHGLFTAQELERAESYERGAVWFAVGALAAQILALAVMAFRGRRLARGIGLGPIGAGIIVGLVTLLAAWAAGIPFTVLETWWDRRYGLTEIGYAEAVISPYAELFGLTVTALVTIVTIMGLARRVGRLWWLAGAPAFAAVATAFAFLIPYLLTAGFDRVADPELKAEIARLEEATGTGPTPVYVEKASDYTNVPNAYAVGIGPSKRVVLWDTLLDGDYGIDELSFVAAHELGHIARDHVWKGLGWFLLLAFPLLLVASEATRRRGGLGLPENIPLAVLVLTLAGICVAPAQNAISRHFEKEADWVALESTRDPEAMRSLFVKFSEDSLSDPTPHAWTQALFGTHPSNLERIAMAEAWRRRNSG